MVKVLFFAQVRELLATSSLEVTLVNQETAESLRQQLAEKSEKWSEVMASDKLLVAVNQVMSTWDTPIKDGDEVAFFPPVTGG